MAMKFPSFRKRNAEPIEQDEEDDQVEGERAMPSVNKGLTLQAKATNYLMFAVVIFMTVFVLYKYYADLMTRKKAAEQAALVDTKTNTVSVLPPLMAPPPPAPGPVVTDSAATAYTPGVDGAPPPPPPPGGTQFDGGNPQQPKPLSPAEVVAKRRLEAPVMFNVGASDSASGQSAAMVGSSSAQGGTGALGSTNSGGGDSGSGGNKGGDPLSANLQGSTVTAVRASLLPNRNFLIAQTAQVECTMPEAIDTTQPGMVSCIQAQDVNSDNGAVILLEKGTVYTGEMKRALLNGQSRAFLLWTRAKTPKGVVINLDSPATDELGRTGITGEVDTHFWARFGNAIMLSLIDDVGSAVVAKQVKGGQGDSNTIVLPNTVQGSQSVMSDVLKITGDIPPTLRKQQGSIVNIYVARDLDFRGVYALQEKTR